MTNTACHETHTSNKAIHSIFDTWDTLWYAESTDAFGGETPFRLIVATTKQTLVCAKLEMLSRTNVVRHLDQRYPWPPLVTVFES